MFTTLKIRTLQFTLLALAFSMGGSALAGAQGMDSIDYNRNQEQEEKAALGHTPPPVVQTPAETITEIITPVEVEEEPLFTPEPVQAAPAEIVPPAPAVTSEALVEAPPSDPAAETHEPPPAPVTSAQSHPSSDGLLAHPAAKENVTPPAPAVAPPAAPAPYVPPEVKAAPLPRETSPGAAAPKAASSDILLSHPATPISDTRTENNLPVEKIDDVKKPVAESAPLPVSTPVPAEKPTISTDSLLAHPADSSSQIAATEEPVPEKPAHRRARKEQPAKNRAPERTAAAPEEPAPIEPAIPIAPEPAPAPIPSRRVEELLAMPATSRVDEEAAAPPAREYVPEPHLMDTAPHSVETRQVEQVAAPVDALPVAPENAEEFKQANDLLSYPATKPARIPAKTLKQLRTPEISADVAEEIAHDPYKQWRDKENDFQALENAPLPEKDAHSVEQSQGLNRLNNIIQRNPNKKWVVR